MSPTHAALKPHDPDRGSPKVTKLALELKVVLDEEASLLTSLLEIMQEEREMLIRFMPNQLLELSKRKELLVLQHAYLDQNRRALAMKLSGELRMETDASLRQLAQAVDGEAGRSLFELHGKLRSLADSIQELNHLNRRLIDYSIKSVKGSVAFLKRRFFASETYSPGGVVNQEIAQLSSVHSRV